MNAPFYINGLFGIDVGLALAVLLGAGFGFVLQRSGFGSSRRLAAQFYLYDMTVFKVMFTAIITTMIGIFGLARLGFLDLEAIWVNPTFLWPQLIGGLMLGAGFIISGLCPGTCIISAVSGKIDGMLTLAGLAIGIFLFGLFYTPELMAFHTSGDFGSLMLSDLLNLDPSILALLITLVAGGAFFLAEKVERKFAGLDKEGLTLKPNNRLRNVSLAAVVVVAAVVIAFPKHTVVPAEAYINGGEISPLALAKLILTEENVTVVDLRNDQEMGSDFITGSMSVTISDFEFVIKMLPENVKYVLILDDAADFGKIILPDGYQAAILKGGYGAWQSEVLTEPQAPTSKSPTAQQRYQLRKDIYDYFTGASHEPPEMDAAGGLSLAERRKALGGCM